jgi:hypothetical protein
MVILLPWSSYGHSTSSYASIAHLNDIDVVETLDNDTARMIEARLEKSSGQSLVTKCKEDLDNDDDTERIIANNNAGSFDSNGDDMIINHCAFIASYVGNIVASLVNCCIIG